MERALEIEMLDSYIDQIGKREVERKKQLYSQKFLENEYLRRSQIPSQATDLRQKQHWDLRDRYQVSRGSVQDLRFYHNQASRTAMRNRPGVQVGPVSVKGGGVRVLMHKGTRSQSNINKKTTQLEANDRFSSQGLGPEGFKSQQLGQMNEQARRTGLGLGLQARSSDGSVPAHGLGPGHRREPYAGPNRVKVPPLKLLNKNNFFIHTGQAATKQPGAQKPVPDDMAKNLGSLQSVDKSLVESWKDSGGKQQATVPRELRNLELMGADNEDAAATTAKDAKMQRVPAGALASSGVASWARSPSSRKDNLLVLGDLEADQQPERPVTAADGQRDLLQMNPMDEPESAMQNQEQVPQSPDDQNAKGKNLTDGMEPVGELYDGDQMGQHDELPLQPDSAAFLNETDGPEGTHLPEIPPHQLMMPGQQQDHDLQLQMLLNPQPEQQQFLDRYSQLPQAHSYLSRPGGPSDDLSASVSNAQALQQYTNFDLTQPVGGAAQLNSDIDYDTHQLLNMPVGDLPWQRRKSNLSAQMPIGTQKAFRMKQQASVYGQNLGKLAELKRKMHAKSIEKEMKDLAVGGGKNFVQSNINRIAQGTTSKLDRLKKLQLQTTKLISENQRLKTQNMNEAESFLHQSIDDIMKQKPEKADARNQGLKKPAPKAGQGKPLQSQEQPLEEKTTEKTLEQFKNLKHFGGQSKRLSHQNNNAGGLRGRGVRHGARGGAAAAQAARSQSRSKSGESQAAGRKKEDGADNSAPKALASGNELSPSNGSPTRSVTKLKQMKKNNRVRSQTAGGAQRASEDVASRRKQQSALGRAPALGNLHSRHKSTAGLNPLSATGDLVNQKRKSTAGRYRMTGNFVGERVQSSATTNKHQFAGVKSNQGRRQNGVHSPPDEEAHSLPELDSNGDIKESRSTFNLPQINANMSQAVKEEKEESKVAAKAKVDVLQNGSPSLSEHSKSININLAGAPSQLSATPKLPLSPTSKSRAAAEAKEGVVAPKAALPALEPPTFQNSKIKSSESKNPSFSFRRGAKPELTAKQSSQKDTAGRQPKSTGHKKTAAAEDEVTEQVRTSKRSSAGAEGGLKKPKKGAVSRPTATPTVDDPPASGVSTTKHAEPTSDITAKSKVGVQKKKLAGQQPKDASPATPFAQTSKLSSTQHLPPKPFQSQSQLQRSAAQPGPNKEQQNKEKPGGRRASKDGKDSSRQDARNKSQTPSMGRLSASSRGFLAGSQTQPSQNIFNAKFQEPAMGGRGQTGREPAPADEVTSMASARPVMDSKGNVAYEPKHRKPKWVMNAELERFNKCEDKTRSQENARDARIRIEDPFARWPESNSVFDHIQEAEISKYITGQAYLEKRRMDGTEVPVVEELLDESLYHEEMVRSVVDEKFNLAQALAEEAIAEVESQFKLPGIEDPEANLKASPSWITNFRTNPTHIEFTKCLRMRSKNRKRRRTLYRQLTFKEQQPKSDVIGEDTPEWRMNFDPVPIERQLMTTGMPPGFQKRYDELQEWRAIMDERVEFKDIKPVLGDAVREQVEELLAATAAPGEYPEKDGWVSLRRLGSPEEAEAQRDIKEKSDMALLLHDLEHSSELAPPSLSWPAVRKPTTEELHAAYWRTFKPTETRALLQTQIVREFKRINDNFVVEYDLRTDSTFTWAMDQSDYRRRMEFQERVISSSNWDTGKIVNDDVYREKQRAKMESRLSELDQSVLGEPGIEVAMLRRCHPECHARLHEKNFKFEQCNEFYYQWYANHQRNLAMKALNKFGNFYGKKRLHETQDSRQAEAMLQKTHTFLERHYSFQELQDQIYRPKWRNIRDPKEKLVLDFNHFNHCFKWFMRQFPGKPAQLPADAKLGDDVEELAKYFFMLDIDFEEDRDLARPVEDPLPRAIETKLNSLAYRCRLTCPEAETTAGFPPFEYFDMVYPIAENFQDKSLLHEALVNFLRRREHRQYLTQKAIHDQRQALKDKKMTKWKARNDEAYERWLDIATKKARRPRRSRSFTKKLKEDPGLRAYVEKLTVGSLFPFTTDFFDLPAREPLTVQEKPVEPFEPVIKPYTDHLCTDYLKALITRYEQGQGLRQHLAAAKGGAVPMKPNQIQQQVARAEGQDGMLVEAIMDPVAPHDPQKEKERCEREDGVFLKWIEAPLGDAKHQEVLALVEDPAIQMGDYDINNMRSTALFRDMSAVFERQREEQRLTKEQLRASQEKARRQRLEEQEQERQRQEEEQKRLEEEQLAVERKTAEIKTALREDLRESVVRPARGHENENEVNDDENEGHGQLAAGDDAEPARREDFIGQEKRQSDDEAKQIKKISSGPAFPEYFPLHLRLEDVPPRRRVLDIFQKAWTPPFAHLYYPPEAPVEQEEIAEKSQQDQEQQEQEQEQEEQAEPAEADVDADANDEQIEEVAEVEEAKEEEAKVEEAPAVDEEALRLEAEQAREEMLARLKLGSSENVLGYVDRQVRKEMADAVQQGDVQLLSNFLDRFGRCITERPENMTNYQSTTTGETVLHLALLMDYDTKKVFYSIEPPLKKKAADTDTDKDMDSDTDKQSPDRGNRSPKSRAPEVHRLGGIGGAILNPLHGLADLRHIKTALSNESTTSLELKRQIIELLVTRAAADPTIKNFHNVAPQDIAKKSAAPQQLLGVLYPKKR